MRLGRKGLILALGVAATSIIIFGLTIIPLHKENKELNSKINRINKMNDDLIKENTQLIDKNGKKSLEINKKDVEIKELEEKLKDFEFKSINFNSNDVTQLTSIKKKQLEILFKSNSTYKNLIGLEKAFVDAESTYGINAMFLLGIISQESGFATSRRSMEDNNLTGYSVYSNSSKGKVFGSKYESIMSTAKLLKEEYVIGRNIKDIKSINEVYCPDDDYKWSNDIQNIISTYRSELEAINSRFNNDLCELG